MSFRIHFQDLPHDEKIKEECQQITASLQDEFPETSKFEVSLKHNGDEHETHVHITGKDLEVASSAKSRDIRESLIEAFERTRRQLRKHHDKVIFARRREAQRSRS